jgi:hypothetical protein
MKKNRKMILTTLLIILILSVNVINTFALDSIISPLSVHVHNFKRVVDYRSVVKYNDYLHSVSTSGYDSCTSCYLSVPFDEIVFKSHTLSSKPVVINNILQICIYCTQCEHEEFH